MVVRYRIGESRELYRVGIGWRWGRIEAKMNEMIYLEDRIACIILENRGFWCRVAGRRGSVLAKNFSGTFWGPMQ